MKATSFLSLISVAILLNFVSACSGSHVNKSAGWQTIFNGRDINDWVVKIHHHEVGENFGNTFRVEDSIIKVRYDQYGKFNDQFAHLYYKRPYSNFHLKFEYRFTGELQDGAPSYTLLNSGIMYHSQDPATMLKEQNWPISIEMQLLAGLGDGQPRPTGNMCSPGTEIVYQGKQYDGHCLNSSSKTYPKDVWVKGELIVYGDSIIHHIIEGDTVLTYSKPSMGGGVVEGYNNALWKPGQPLKSGFIALQSEGQPVDFRKIQIKELSSE